MYVKPIFEERLFKYLKSEVSAYMRIENCSCRSLAPGPMVIGLGELLKISGSSIVSPMIYRGKVTVLVIYTCPPVYKISRVAPILPKI